MEICKVGCSVQNKSKPIACLLQSSNICNYSRWDTIDTSKSFFSYTSLFKQSWSVVLCNLKRMLCFHLCSKNEVKISVAKNMMADVESLETLNMSCVICYRQPLSCVLLVENKKMKKKNFVWCFLLLLENIRKQKWN